MSCPAWLSDGGRQLVHQLRQQEVGVLFPRPPPVAQVVLEGRRWRGRLLQKGRVPRAPRRYSSRPGSSPAGPRRSGRFELGARPRGAPGRLGDRAAGMERGLARKKSVPGGGVKSRSWRRLSGGAPEVEPRVSPDGALAPGVPHRDEVELGHRGGLVSFVARGAGELQLEVLLPLLQAAPPGDAGQIRVSERVGADPEVGRWVGYSWRGPNNAWDSGERMGSPGGSWERLDRVECLWEVQQAAVSIRDPTSWVNCTPWFMAGTVKAGEEF